MAIKKIDFTEAKQILDTKPACIIVDVREEEEYITGHAVGALLFPVDEINDVSAMMLIPDKDRPYILYCRSGRRSAEAAHKLDERGYTQLSDVGSLIGWPYGLE